MSTKLNWHPVKSTQIKRIAFDALSQTAIVHFKNGTIYEYSDFGLEKFEQFKAAESAGKFLGNEVKGKHPYKKITDPAQLIELMTEDKPHIGGERTHELSEVQTDGGGKQLVEQSEIADNPRDGK